MAKNCSCKKFFGLNRESGNVSLLVLLVTFSLSWIGVQTFILISSQERVVVYEAQKVKTAYMADSGLEYAKAVFARDPSWQGTLQYDSGGVVVEIEGIRANDVTQITSRATMEKIKQCRYGELVLGEDGKFELAGYRYCYD
ncbi:hypothetical protein A7K50_10815 [Dehalobacter sp. MCB1]|nr:hypothetical protein A7K50_10815 [Dehalobacter sp. MCB1]TCX50658.1 hypothetical protein C1I36_07710 [Dehalobacter sp. 14DCB1]TCX52433.1 hypothetical protein C1I38_10020 [Dehalobacter sp. 12DCB1]